MSAKQIPRKPDQYKRSDFSTLPWDVTADGKRFLSGKTKALYESVTVGLNWSSELNNKYVNPVD